jgi:hypothetical protein
MSEHTYKPGDLVERISTKSVLPFVRYSGKQVHVLASENQNSRTMASWPASDCRPSVDHAAEQAAKDARIAELEAQVSAEKDAYHKLANEAQEKYTRLFVVERENANLRNLCGMDLPWPLHDTVAKLVEATKAFLHKHDNDAQGWEEWHCAAQYGEEYAKQLRAAAEGGE